MANTGIRQLTTVVGGYAKRIWYAINGTTPTAELMSIDDAGKFKCVSEQITGLAGTGSRMVVTDSSGNLSASVASDVFISGAFATPQSTGININAGSNDKTITAYISTFYGEGLQVTSAIIMITCGYNGNNFVATTVSSYGSFGIYGVEFSQVSGVLHVKTLNGSSCTIRFTSNR